ncbi:DUF1878 family protein [Fervidibacillus halotolerans]|uniref:YhaI family protein n=1 Tax=Fervidibacillus halotolerans TaxID=2980027 RepID=A0A9E8M135_9BACI|nr:DUF1878 family protein [Fervidibacillus halotolerans]WAA13012.1 YhaI family protein [Fervidibacillus halotolerans]
MNDELLKRIQRLEYHQRLLLQLIKGEQAPFTKLIIEKNLDEEEVKAFHNLCEYMNNKMEEQKAEGFLYFHPLFQEFTSKLNSKLDAKETVIACIKEKVYLDLMKEFYKYVED